MQSPSFLAHQRDMQQRKGKDNTATLFGVSKIPSDNQIRNLLDPVTPDHFWADFEWIHQELEQSGRIAAFADYKSTYLVTFDGVVFHSSEKVHCDNCSHRQDRNGRTHYYHKHSRTKAHDWRGLLMLDFDLSGLTCGKQAQGSTKGYFAGKKTALVAN